MVLPPAALTQATEEDPPAVLLSEGLVENAGRCLPELNRPQLSTQEAPPPAAPPREELKEPRTKEDPALLALGGLAVGVLPREHGVNVKGCEAVVKLEAIRQGIRW